MRNKDDKCQIELRKETRVKLQELRICNRESYDEVINRLIVGEDKNGKNI